MKTWKVAIEYVMVKTLEIEAEDLDDAMEQAEEMEATGGEYLDGSFTVDRDQTEELNTKDDDEDGEEDED